MLLRVFSRLIDLLEQLALHHDFLIQSIKNTQNSPPSLPSPSHISPPQHINHSTPHHSFRYKPPMPRVLSKSLHFLQTLELSQGRDISGQENGECRSSLLLGVVVRRLWKGRRGSIPVVLKGRVWGGSCLAITQLTFRIFFLEVSLGGTGLC